MSLINKILPSSNIFLDLDVGSKKRVFEYVGILFENSHGIARSVIFDSLFAREKLGSTALGQGVAVPHGRIKGLKQACGAFYRLQTPLEFDAPDNQPVSICFVLLVPQDANEQHLQILGELAQLFGDEAMRAKLHTIATPNDLIALISAWTS